MILQLHSKGHAVFFDFLGLFFVTYTEKTGIILNYCLAVISLLLVGGSIWRMSSQSENSIVRTCMWFGIILGLHLIGCLLCMGLPLLMSVLYDVSDRTMTYYSNNWLVIGLYICPAIIGLVLPSTLFYAFKTNVRMNYSFVILFTIQIICYEFL